ncbi:hypothetical protein R3W88_026220 [Solanum pinnatisectum]|uniref:NAC domain-containing protein n=1 Tax=Solanum pinnatisectum TaxID=50273 RepID=A0AAV9LCK9_9SOLN|nr:hypothetical protein R3W88_026220 [Solanum pinnatisectum]
MESTDSSIRTRHQPQLPPGFRFHPTDEELVIHYLKKRVAGAPIPVDIIAEIDLYKFDPWELPAKAIFGEQEWYFFSPRDRKYPNGARPNRAATSGYWKATGTDKPVFTSGGTQKVGVKKALVFYGGKPPKGVKTNWIMHEYRVVENKTNNKAPGCDHIVANKKGSLRLDDWVLCRIYKKNNTERSIDDDMLGQNSILEGIKAPSNDGIMNNRSVPQLPSKRWMYWNMDEATTDISPNTKRLVVENNDGEDGLNMNNNNITNHEESNSIANFLSQPSIQQQVLGSLSDGVVFRQPYNQVTGMNWYS